MIEELCNFNIAGKYEIAYIVDENLKSATTSCRSHDGI
jgi:hypothetical protein